MAANSGQSILADQEFITFFSDGSYVFGSHQNDSTCPDSGNGVEKGTYAWTPVGNVGPITFSATLAQIGDSNTGCGVAPGSAGQTMTKNADGSLTYTASVVGGSITLKPVTFTAGSPILGSFQAGTSGTTYVPAATDNGSAFVILIDSTHYFLTESAGAKDDSSDLPGVEDGCYSINASHQITTNTSSSCTTASGQPGIHTTGDGGLSGIPAGSTLVVSTPETSTQLEMLSFTPAGATSITLTHIPTQ